MAKNRPLALRAVELAEECASRLDQWRAFLLRFTDGSMPGLAEDDFLGKEMRAAAVVATMAELERLVREILVGLSYEINGARLEVRRLVPGVRVLAAHSKFQSLSDTRNADSHWASRLEVSRLELDTEIARLPGPTSSGPQPPLDGRTIRPSHLRRVWSLLEIGGDAMPSASADASITKLASVRNDVAHANAPIDELFHRDDESRSAKEIARYIEDATLVLLHIGSEIADYARQRRYRVDRSSDSPAAT
ncbi:hypothetical protein [Xylanimonas ulmi]|uniref:hypothetical protein n=1 Tax=Xylanimonas ulmi TaxID=228973 RepID=UPI00102CD072|nr:hypothetical protein [Xylanibacterium ulmi]